MSNRIEGEEATRYWYGKSVILGERVAELEARVAELEAAQEWRPVTDPPDEDGVYLVWRGHNIDPPPGWAEISGYATRSDVWRIDYPYGDSVTHWQPLPAPPQ